MRSPYSNLARNTGTLATNALPANGPGVARHEAEQGSSNPLSWWLSDEGHRHRRPASNYRLNGRTVPPSLWVCQMRRR